jgi:ABC-2 type transport system ATP-binding protein
MCRELTDEAVRFVGLENFCRFYPKKLSGGLLRRLNIACGIAHKPKLIILDEPTVAVDPQSRNNILEGILALNRQGATVIYTSHYMEEVEQICTRIAIMDKGKVIASGTTGELKGMIKTGERITAELFCADDGVLAGIRQLSGIYSAQMMGTKLMIRSGHGKNNLPAVLDYLNAATSATAGFSASCRRSTTCFLK